MVGARFDLSDGREVVLVQNGATALVAGHLIGGPANVANHLGLVVTAYSAATTSTKATVTVTLGGTRVYANEYAGGFLVVQTLTGAGQIMKIDSHPAQATTTGSVVITLADAPAVALDTTSTVGLILNPYGSANGAAYTTNGVLITSATMSSRGQIAGMCFYAIPASTSTVLSYGLLQTKGVVNALNDANSTAGLGLMPSTNTAGALMTFAVTGPFVGNAIMTGTTTAYGTVFIEV
jgi:hypothetical protein